jgi:hypothetical protein
MYIITYERNLFLLKLIFHMFLSSSSGQKLFFFCLGKKELLTQSEALFSGWVFFRTIALAGFEPAHDGTKNRCLTTWL